MKPGTRIGPYEITGALGAGGMGEVYRAHDPRLEREVALKVLPAEMAADPARIERFEREAKTVASISNPHIVKIYSVEQEGDVRFLTMELIEGQELDEFLTGRPMPLQRLLEIGTGVADALAAAHDKGIVHRDLKPANVMLTRDDHVQVLDFGLARPATVFSGDNSGTEVATELAPITEQGQVVGTVAYMSPEQAQGQPVDARSDVFSLGILLYQMATGQQPFGGETRMSVLSAIIREQPAPASQINAGIPRHLGRMIAKCLHKDPTRRYQSALGVRNDLDALAEELRSGEHEITAVASSPPASTTRRAALAIGLPALLVAAVVIGWYLRGDAPALVLGNNRQITRAVGLEIHPALSPDGDFVAYAAGPQGRMRLYVRSISGGRAVPLTEEFPGDHQSPRWSPDSSRLAFASEGSVWTVPALGGVPRQVLADQGVRIRGLDWSPDGESLVASVGTSLVVVPRSGSEARSLSVDNAHSPAWSPDGRWIAFVRGNNDYGYTPTALGNIGAAAVMMVPAGGGEIIDLTGTAALNIGPVWLRDSRGLLFVSDRDGSRDVYRLSVDRNGEPGATTRLTTALDAHTIHLSADGSRLAYSEFRYGTNVWSLPIPEGPPASVADAVQLTRGDQVVEAMAVSPDGQWLTYDSSLSGNQDLFRMPIDGGEEEQLTTDPTPDFMTSYSPDGSEIAFFSMRTGERKVYTMPVTGGTPVQVTFGPGEHRYPTFSPDGLRLAYSISDVSTVPAGISVVTRAGPGQPGTNEMLLTEDGGNRPRWSPDGESIAYVITASTGTRLVLVSPDGGEPRDLLAVDDRSVRPAPEFTAWSADGRTVYYTAYDDFGRSSIWSIPAAGGEPTLKVRFDDPTRWAGRREFATDGENFYFTIGIRESDVWVMELQEQR